MPRTLFVSATSHLAAIAAGVLGAGLLLRLVAGLDWCGIAIASAAYLTIAAAVLVGLRGNGGQLCFGSANALTLVRAGTVAILLGILGDGALTGALGSNTKLRWILATAAMIALLLDGADGWIARRTGMSSDFGAQFDVETDAIFMLALSLLVYRIGEAGVCVVFSGMMRYFFVLAGFVWISLARPLPPSQRRKCVCVVQMGSLIAALSPAVPAKIGWALCLASFCLLTFSFVWDIGWLSVRSDADPCKPK